MATLVFGRPEHLELRRASVRGSLGASEFKVTFNDSGLNVGNLTAPVDAARLRALLTAARVNMIEWPVCDCAYDHWKFGSSCSAMYGYEGLVRFLDATRDFRVAGRQFRLWMLLLPPTEALPPTGCTPPPDSNLPSWNETALFDVALGYADFEAFLADLKQSRRKAVRQERRKVADAGVVVKRLRGSEIEPRHWDALHTFYMRTVEEKWGRGYLKREFFDLLGRDAAFAERALLVIAEEEASGELVAGAWLLTAFCVAMTGFVLLAVREPNRPFFGFAS